MVILNSCNNNDGPDYGKMKYGRMDIAGASAIGFIGSDGNTRAEALSSGLYKIDANGNISAVAVYFTEDSEGNEIKKEDKVTLQQAEMKEAGNDFLCFANCWFINEKGDRISGLPNHILVRKADGKMWNLDIEVMPSWVYVWLVEFFEDNNGSLYMAKGDYESGHVPFYNEIYKFNFSPDNASIEQIAANVEMEPPFSVTPDGVLMSEVNSIFTISWKDHGLFSWPHSGFQVYSTLYEDLGNDILSPIFSNNEKSATCRTYNTFIINFRGQPYCINNYNTFSYKGDQSANNTGYPFVKFGRCDKIQIGAIPGSAKVDLSDPIMLTNDVEWPSFEMRSLLVTPDYVLIAGCKSWNSPFWITALNPITKEWKWIVNSPTEIDLTDGIKYKDSIWCINTENDNFGAFWFNPKTLKSGFVKFSTSLPSYMGTEFEYIDGKVIFSGVNPADSHKVKLIIDIATGDTVTDDKAPEMLFQSLIPLN